MRRFPHDKLCGEFLSPECAGPLQEPGDRTGAGLPGAVPHPGGQFRCPAAHNPPAGKPRCRMGRWVSAGRRSTPPCCTKRAPGASRCARAAGSPGSREAWTAGFEPPGAECRLDALAEGAGGDRRPGQAQPPGRGLRQAVPAPLAPLRRPQGPLQRPAGRRPDRRCSPSRGATAASPRSRGTGATSACSRASRSSSR